MFHASLSNLTFSWRFRLINDKRTISWYSIEHTDKGEIHDVSKQQFTPFLVSLTTQMSRYDIETPTTTTTVARPKAGLMWKLGFFFHCHKWMSIRSMISIGIMPISWKRKAMSRPWQSNIDSSSFYKSLPSFVSCFRQRNFPEPNFTLFCQSNYGNFFRFVVFFAFALFVYLFFRNQKRPHDTAGSRFRSGYSMHFQHLFFFLEPLFAFFL